MRPVPLLFSFPKWIATIVLCLFGSMAFAQEAPPEKARDIDELINVLEDDTARQRLIDRLVQLNAASTEPVETDAVNQLVTYLEDKQRAVDGVVIDIIASTAQKGFKSNFYNTKPSKGNGRFSIY